MTGLVMVTKGVGCAGRKGGGRGKSTAEEEEQNQQLSLVEFLLTALRKSVVSCRVDNRQDDVGGGISSAVHQMEIGWPTNVRHITHVTFDRFHGFLGLPHELQVEIPCRVPSASVSVFGVSAESMQCSYDEKGNSVPTILLLMQQRLYSQQGLKAEGIFRINPENSQEEHVRDQLNRGIVPENIDVHCLAGLIKAWFRELPCGVLDGLSPEEVLNCNTEEDSVQLIKQLKPTESALLNWAVDLMADVVEEEESNKMNARNIAMVFAPNMTQMTDPLTALMHAVQVMNLLKTLITRTLAEREETSSGSEEYSPSHSSNSQTDSDSDNAQDMEVSCESQSSGSESGGEEEKEEKEQQEEEHLSRRLSTQEDENDIGSLSSVEKCFLSQINNSARVSNVSISEDWSPKCSPLVSFTDDKNDTLGSSTKD
ncbi:Rho GTPase-activating protein 2 [Hirschfeldia incana]|nr:Rho GTPase-activating protein 2 [Hirschfeldia incana]